MNLIHGIEEKDFWKNPVTVFYHSDRCMPLKKYEKESKYKFYPYTKLGIIIFFLRNYTNIYLYVPHFKVGTIIKFLSKFAKEVGIIDDGLDTFRDYPKNVKLQEFKSNVSYLTFSYEMPIGQWLSNTKVHNIINQSWLLQSSSKKIDLSSYKYLLIESPNVHEIFNKYNFCSKDVLVIRHPSPLKKDEEYKYLNELNGKDIAIEDSIDSFRGHLFIGATMVLVSVVLGQIKPNKVSIILNSFESSNYEPLIKEAKKRIVNLEIILV
jgi:hypothetical protein